MYSFVRIACALCASISLTAGISHAADLGPGPKEPVSAWSLEVGARYWYSTGETGFDLYDGTGNVLVSRLTYEDLSAHSGELFFRGDHSSGFFVKGYVGGGNVNSGNLIDEDFLREAYRRTSKTSAPGIDRVTAKEYAENLDENLRDLYERVRSGRYIAH